MCLQAAAEQEAGVKAGEIGPLSRAGWVEAKANNASSQSEAATLAWISSSSSSSSDDNAATGNISSDVIDIFADASSSSSDDGGEFGGVRVTRGDDSGEVFHDSDSNSDDYEWGEKDTEEVMRLVSLDPLVVREQERVAREERVQREREERAAEKEKARAVRAEEIKRSKVGPMFRAAPLSRKDRLALRKLALSSGRLGTFQVGEWKMGKRVQRSVFAPSHWLFEKLNPWGSHSLVVAC